MGDLDRADSGVQTVAGAGRLQRRRPRVAWLYALGLSLVLVAGCGEPVRVHTAEGQQAAVSHFKTFGMVLPDAEELEENQMRPETFRRLAELSIEQMKLRGYEPAAVPDAELLVALSPGLNVRKEFRAYGRTGRPDSTLSEQTTAEGSMTVSFVDVRGKRVVLTRVVETRVSMQLGEDQMREIIAGVFEGTPRAAP